MKKCCVPGSVGGIPAFGNLIYAYAEHLHLAEEVGECVAEKFLAAGEVYILFGIGCKKESHATPGVYYAMVLEVFKGLEHGVGIDGHAHRELTHRRYAAVGAPGS